MRSNHTNNAMRIAVIAASGKVGRLIALEAFDRGMEVTAIVRDRKKIDIEKYGVIEKGIMEITTDDVKNFDVVVSAFGTDPGKEYMHQTVLKHLTDVFEQIPAVRLLVVGGAASLYLNEEKTAQLIDTIPPEWKAVPENMLKAFNELKKSKVNWTFFSPAGFFDPNGPRTGKYTLGTDYVILNKSGRKLYQLCGLRYCDGG